MSKSPEERFFDKVIKGRNEKDCWEWVASTVGNSGYGKIAVDGRLVLAHRFSWELYNNQSIPFKLIVRHKCDNPPCTNSLHLELGTLKDNLNDARIRGNLLTLMCKYGHAWSEENTYLAKSPSLNGRIKRVCKVCVRRRQRECYLRKRKRVK